MTPLVLSDEEVAALPRRRPRWVCHLVAAVFLVADAAFYLGVRDWTDRAGSRLDPWYVEDARSLFLVVPGLLLLPVYRRVSFRRRDALFFLLVPAWGLVIAWKAGFRLTSLPYRDWPPRPDERPLSRSIPRTSYHVVLDAPEPARALER
jgi:hypothetical protein